MKQKEWTDVETRQLEVLCDLGAGVAYMAASLGRPVNAVLDRMQEMGLAIENTEEMPVRHLCHVCFLRIPRREKFYIRCRRPDCIVPGIDAGLKDEMEAG